MTDAEYLLKQEQREKKSNGRGVYSKKGGSKSKACRLPNDNLTNAQWKRMCGEVITMNMSKPMEYKAFKKLPPDLRKEYICNLRDNYGARCKDIADMFEVQLKTLNHQTKNLGIDFPRSRQNVDPRWIEFLKGSGLTAEEVREEAQEEAVEPEEIVEPMPLALAKRSPNIKSQDGVIHLVGDPYIAFARVLKVLDDKKDYDITVMFKEVCNTDEET